MQVFNWLELILPSKMKKARHDIEMKNTLLMALQKFAEYIDSYGSRQLEKAIAFL